MWYIIICEEEICNDVHILLRRAWYEWIAMELNMGLRVKM